MDDDLQAKPEVNYVLVLNKGPLLLMGVLVFGLLALRCWDEWSKLYPTEPEE